MLHSLDTEHSSIPSCSYLSCILPCQTLWQLESPVRPDPGLSCIPSIVLVVVQGEEGLHLQLPDGVDRALFGHMKDLNPALSIGTLYDLEAISDHGVAWLMLWTNLPSPC